MVRHGLVTRREIARHARQHVAFRWRGEHIGDLADVSAAHWPSRRPARRRRRTARRADYDERLAGRIWDGTRQLRILDLGDPVWLVTGAPVELAEIVARRLGFSGALGTVSEIENGTWTGRLVGTISRSCEGRGRRALARHQRFDLGECVAYSDSINDLPLLDLVAIRTR